MKKKAVLLLNMGGPESLEEVRPFLFNLFNDKHILRLPCLIRFPLAFLLSLWRASKAKIIYKTIGGRSPLNKNTLNLAKKLEITLGSKYQCFVGMSYVNPFIKEAVKKIKEINPEEIILLPLYPQYSMTTNASVLFEAQKEIKKQIGNVSIKEIKEFHVLEGYIQALSMWVSKEISKASREADVQILFSAHGLPQKYVRQGDNYPQFCQKTVQAIVSNLKLETENYKLCYQSRLGPMKWTGPFLNKEISKEAKKGKALIIVPISFVCENSETLYELDIVYRQKALQKGCVYWGRVKAVSENDDFINSLSRLIKVNAL